MTSKKLLQSPNSPQRELPRDTEGRVLALTAASFSPANTSSGVLRQQCSLLTKNRLRCLRGDFWEGLWRGLEGAVRSAVKTHCVQWNSLGEGTDLLLLIWRFQQLRRPRGVAHLHFATHNSLPAHLFPTGTNIKAVETSYLRMEVFLFN